MAKILSPGQRYRSALRMLEVWEYLGKCRHGATARQIAEAVGIHYKTARRMLEALSSSYQFHVTNEPAEQGDSGMLAAIWFRTDRFRVS